MGDLILLFLLLGSTAGIVIILARKISLVREVDPIKENIHFRDALHQLVGEAKQKMSESERLKLLSPEKVLHKTLSKTRVLALKTESKTSTWLERLRQRSQEKDDKFSETYWYQLKRTPAKKASPRKRAPKEASVVRVRRRSAPRKKIAATPE